MSILSSHHHDHRQHLVHPADAEHRTAAFRPRLRGEDRVRQTAGQLGADPLARRRPECDRRVPERLRKPRLGRVVLPHPVFEGDTIAPAAPCSTPGHRNLDPRWCGQGVHRGFTQNDDLVIRFTRILLVYQAGHGPRATPVEPNMNSSDPRAASARRAVEALLPPAFGGSCRGEL